MSLFGAVVDGLRLRQPNRAHALVIDQQQVTLSGSNPTTVKFPNLDTVLGAQISLVQSTSPGLDPTDFTYVIDGTNANQVDVYAWKCTSNSNPTLIASTNSTAVINVTVLGFRRYGQTV